MSNPGHPRNREAEAAAYVSGAMAPRRRRRFERHLLQCGDCWDEVRADRVGRRLAETAREVAPADLREAVRASVAAGIDPGRRVAARRPSRVLLAAALLVIVVSTGTFLVWQRTAAEPRPIAAALDAYHHHPPNGIVSRDAPDLSSVGLSVMGSERMSLAGMPVEAFAYRSPAGATLSLYMGHTPFPQASASTPAAMGASDGWRAERDGMQMIGGGGAASYLVVTDDAGLADRFAGALSTGQIAISV